jgi:hypothetical protein
MRTNAWERDEIRAYFAGQHFGAIIHLEKVATSVRRKAPETLEAEAAGHRELYAGHLEGPGASR